MKKLNTFYYVLFYLLFALLFIVCSQPPIEDPSEILSRSVEKHGSEALSNWETMVVKGEVVQEDIGFFRGEYLQYAQKPDKFRAERDLTKFERGRLFYTYIYNNGVGWMQTNLMPSYREQYSKAFKRWLDRCDGIAYYAQNAEKLEKKPDEKVNGKDAYVVSAIIDTDTTTLYIDKKNFHFVQDVYKNVTRIYSEFKKFGETIHATEIKEIQTRGENTSEVSFKYNTIEYNVPIEQWIFEEDMPKK